MSALLVVRLLRHPDLGGRSKLTGPVLVVLAVMRGLLVENPAHRMTVTEAAKIQLV